MLRKRLIIPITFSLILTSLWALLFSPISDTLAVNAVASNTSTLNRWFALRQNAGRTGFNPSETILGPNLSFFNSFTPDDPAASLFTNILVDDEKIFVQNLYDLWVYNRTDLSLLWRYGECLTGSCLIGGYTSVSSDYVVLLKQDYLANQSELVVLDASQGAESSRGWTRTIPGDLNPAIVVDGTRVYLLWQDNGYHLEILSIFTGNLLYTPASGSFSGAFANGGPVVAGGKYYVAHGDVIIAHSTAGGNELWRYSDTTRPNSIQYDLVALDNVLFVTQGERVFALKPADGSILWSIPAASCDPGYIPRPSTIATDGTHVAVVGICNEDVVVYDLVTGAEKWRDTIGPIPSPNALAIANGVLYVAALPDPTEYYLFEYNLATGTLLEQFPMNVGDQTPVLAISNQNIFTVSGISDTGVKIFERTPADLATQAFASQTQTCGAMVGGKSSYRFTVTNNGDGVADNIQVNLNLPPGTANITTTRGTCSHGNPASCELESLAKGELVEITAVITHTQDGTYNASIEILQSEPRDPDASNNLAVLEDPIIVAPQPPSGVDLQATYLEITQGIQDLNNSVQLVAGKPTLARAYIQTDGPQVNNVTALLHARNASTNDPLPGSPINPLQDFGCINVDDSLPSRGEIDSAVLFRVPDEWISNEIILEVEINPGGMIPDTDNSNNKLADTIQFENQPPVCIRTYPVSTEGFASGDPWGVIVDPIPADDYLVKDPDKILARTLTLFPVSEMIIFPESEPIQEWKVVGYGPYNLEDGWIDDWKILDSLFWINFFTDDPDDCDDKGARTHYLGMIHDGAFGTFTGIALFDELAVRMIPSKNTDPNRDFNYPLGGQKLAHELGHNYFRWHINCGDIPFLQPDDEDYPYDCLLGPNSWENYYGFDTLNIEGELESDDIIIPTAASDVMSYLDDRWISNYNWDAIGREICENKPGSCTWSDSPTTTALVAAETNDVLVPDLSNDVMVISGRIMTDSIQIDNAYQFTQTVTTETKLESFWVEQNRNVDSLTSGYVLELLDPSGAILYSQPFTATHTHDRTIPMSRFGLVVPFDAATAEIQVSSTITPSLVATRTVSANPPSVTILSPNGGETFTDTMTISWQGQDIDGDELSYILQYSNDLGQTWRVLVANTITNTITVDSSLLPGSISESLIQVIASDGVRSGSDRSDSPFTIKLREPIAAIHQPEDKESYKPGSIIRLKGVGFDPEDGQIPGNQLSWTITGMGVVGTGKQISLEDLPIGLYELTLTATDSDGQSSSDSITFRVGNMSGIFLPIIHR